LRFAFISLLFLIYSRPTKVHLNPWSKFRGPAQNKQRLSGGNNGVRSNFDFFRLSKGKEEVDICSNTLRSYHRAGLPFYRRGKAVFVSKRELEYFIRANATAPACPKEVG
jgi:hypothetical protein